MAMVKQSQSPMLWMVPGWIIGAFCEGLALLSKFYGLKQAKFFKSFKLEDNKFVCMQLPYN